MSWNIIWERLKENYKPTQIDDFFPFGLCNILIFSNPSHAYVQTQTSLCRRGEAGNYYDPECNTFN